MAKATGIKESRIANIEAMKIRIGLDDVEKLPIFFIFLSGDMHDTCFNSLCLDGMEILGASVGS